VSLIALHYQEALPLGKLSFPRTPEFGDEGDHVFIL
jgi:hypothetical protein